ncbi:MAG: polysaccharide pyruvyl transferase family protein [Planctomycetaceae bacterium]|nr:polysaccharide pyruvyl transferase family protein [Planctomycetaceae bacterium]
MPNYGNMGDIIIAQAEYQLFDKFNFQYKIFDETITENLVYGGGGIFVKNWCHCYQWLLELFQKTELQKIIILPSSFYDCPDLLEIIDERFIIFCREQQSYDYLVQSNKKAKYYLENDMAFFLKSNFLKTRNTRRLDYRNVYDKLVLSLIDLREVNGFKIAYFLRADSEKKVHQQDFDLLQTIDLSNSINSDSSNKNDCNFYSKLFLAAIDSADIIVTDRLHVGIGSMLLGKEVFLIDNSYGKVSEVYRYSMQNIARVHFIDDICFLSDEINNRVKNEKIRITANTKNLNRIGKFL